MIVVAVIDLALATFASSALGAATPQAAARCDKFAAPSGSDLHAGSLKHPYRTPRRLLWSLKNGQTGCLRGGTYGTADSYHRLLSGGAPKHRKTLTAYPGERATIDGYVELLGSYVTLRNLVFDGSNSRLVNPYKCGTQALGLLLQGHDEIFEHNEVFQSGNKGSAIIQHGDRNIIRYNKLHDFGACYAYDHGVYVRRRRLGPDLRQLDLEQPARLGRPGLPGSHERAHPRQRDRLERRRLRHLRRRDRDLDREPDLRQRRR